MRKALKFILQQAGFNQNNYGTHSMWAGRRVDLLKYGVSVETVKEMGSWKSNAVFTYLKTWFLLQKIWKLSTILGLLVMPSSKKSTTHSKKWGIKWKPIGNLCLTYMSITTSTVFGNLWIQWQKEWLVESSTHLSKHWILGKDYPVSCWLSWTRTL